MYTCSIVLHVQSDKYSIDSANRGAVLIINNNFNSEPHAKGPVFYGRLPKRTGTDQDQRSLITLFTEHLQGFWPHIVPDVAGSVCHCGAFFYG